MTTSNLKAEKSPKLHAGVSADQGQNREHKTTTALPLSLNSGKGQAVQKRDLGLQKVFFFKTKKKSNEILLNSLPYSQFTPELGIINQGRPSPQVIHK